MENIKVPENANLDDIVVTGVKKLIEHKQGNSGSLVFPKHATIELKGVKIVFEKEAIGLHDIVDAGNQFLDLIKNLQP